MRDQTGIRTQNLPNTNRTLQPSELSGQTYPVPVTVEIVELAGKTVSLYPNKFFLWVKHYCGTLCPYIYTIKSRDLQTII